MLENIKTIIEVAIRQQNLLRDEPIDLSRAEDSTLYGDDGTVDSLSLVSIIIDIEQQIRDQFGVEVHLADTFNLPQSATPFSTFGALSEYVMGRLSTALKIRELDATRNPEHAEAIRFDNNAESGNFLRG
ncbi:MAG: acyl carrier protein [Pseudomonadota bacterium]